MQSVGTRRARRSRQAPQRFNVCSPDPTIPTVATGVRKRRSSQRIPAVKRNQAPAKVRSGKNTAPGRTVKKKARPAEVTDASCLKLVGKCVRIDWPAQDSPEEGEYTAMIFSYNSKSGKHKLFYYPTVETPESFEEVDLFDGIRTWHVEPPPAMRIPQEAIVGRNKGAPDPRNLIGRRVWVEWPDETSGKPRSFDAVIVDYVQGSEFRIVYVEDEWVENRDLVSSELAWELYEGHSPAGIAAPQPQRDENAIEQRDGNNREQMDGTEVGPKMPLPAVASSFAHDTSSAIGATSASTGGAMPKRKGCADSFSAHAAAASTAAAAAAAAQVAQAAISRRANGRDGAPQMPTNDLMIDDAPLSSLPRGL